MTIACTPFTSAAFFVFAVWGVLRHFNDVGTLNLWRIPFGGPVGLMETALTEPEALFRYLLDEGRPRYLWQLLAPLALVPLLAPEVVLIAAGPLLSNLLSTFWYQHNIRYHYDTLIIPILMLAAVVGISRLRPKEVRVGVATVMLLGAILGAHAWGPLPFGQYRGLLEAVDHPRPEAIREAIDLIPGEAAVSAYYPYVTHLAHRVEIYQWPTPFRARYWGLKDREGQWLPQADGVEYVIVPDTVAEGPDAHVLDRVRERFELVHDEGGVWVFRNQVNSPQSTVHS